VRPVHPAVLRAERALLDVRREALAGGAVHVGWKVGHAIGEVEALAGRRPAVGFLTTATLVEDGGTYRPERPVALRAETELVVEIDEALGIAGLGVALEIVDVGRPPEDAHGIIAANVFHRAFALGSKGAATLPEDGRATLTVAGRVSDADEPLPDPRATVEAVGDLLAAVGERLRAGDRILAGSVVHVPVAPGDHLVAELPGVGRVAMHLAG
jgi:2-keto-4-pentenoate hydratase